MTLSFDIEGWILLLDLVLTYTPANLPHIGQAMRVYYDQGIGCSPVVITRADCAKFELKASLLSWRTRFLSIRFI